MFVLLINIQPRDPIGVRRVRMERSRQNQVRGGVNCALRVLTLPKVRAVWRALKEDIPELVLDGVSNIARLGRILETMRESVICAQLEHTPIQSVTPHVKSVLKTRTLTLKDPHRALRAHTVLRVSGLVQVAKQAKVIARFAALIIL